jgi:NAD(P)-dependent dehydrogenase (short-subunit alcohol dehydrogenase family)
MAFLGLADRVCVVTGGGSGIGAETAHYLSSARARVAILDRHADAAAEVAAQIVAQGGRAIGIEADVGSRASVVAAAARVEQVLGPAHVLVNNAAIRHRESLLSIGTDAWDRLMAVNLTAPLVCTQVFAAQMIAAGHGGSVVHVASMAGHNPLPGSGSYSVSKAGLMMLSRALAVELGAHGIRSNSVSPGFVRTPANEGAYRDPQRTAARERAVPVGRIAQPVDIARVIAFLASDVSAYVDGQDILVDGAIGSTLMHLAPSLAADKLAPAG